MQYNYITILEGLQGSVGTSALIRELSLYNTKYDRFRRGKVRIKYYATERDLITEATSLQTNLRTRGRDEILSTAASKYLTKAYSRGLLARQAVTFPREQA